MTLNQSETRLLEACSAPLLKNTADKVIHAAIMRGMLILGITGERLPSNEVVHIMVNECKEVHGLMTIKELSLAFDMAAREQLEFNATTYQNFSVLFLNQLLTAYKKWASGVRPKFTEEQYEASQRVQRFPIFQRKSLDEHRENIQNGFQDYLIGQLPSVEWVPYEWYQVLVEDGFIEFDGDAIMTKNCLSDETTIQEKAALKRGQEYVWQLFEMAKFKNKNLYVRS